MARHSHIVNRFEMIGVDGDGPISFEEFEAKASKMGKRVRRHERGTRGIHHGRGS